MTLLKTCLDNPIWHALTSHQSVLARGNSLARRFPPDVSPLAGFESPSPEAYEALAKLAEEDKPIVLFLEEPAKPTHHWKLELEGPITQMVYEGDRLPESGFEMVRLTQADVPEILSLVKLTQPGPFEVHTLALGMYVGIRQEGKLVAMAGERLHLTGYTEISAVCTHPDFRGRGYANALIRTVINHILARGETPFLHAWAGNDSAIRVYERMGFRHCRYLHVAVLKLQDA
jgi:ribosomal protein S18 acetylase RimI-like enzyme